MLQTKSLYIRLLWKLLGATSSSRPKRTRCLDPWSECCRKLDRRQAGESFQRRSVRKNLQLATRKFCPLGIVHAALQTYRAQHNRICHSPGCLFLQSQKTSCTFWTHIRQFWSSCG